jgi:hypothetical protein
VSSIDVFAVFMVVATLGTVGWALYSVGTEMQYSYKGSGYLSLEDARALAVEESGDVEMIGQPLEDGTVWVAYDFDSSNARMCSLEGKFHPEMTVARIAVPIILGVATLGLAAGLLGYGGGK